MTAPRPAARPRLTRAELMLKVAALDRRLLDAPLLIVGVRGYYRDTMGAVGRNDRAMYDDALFVVGADGTFAAFNANTDPSGYRKGHGFGAAKGMASLNPGVWPVYRLDMHRRGTKGQHEALCQRAGPVTVTRDGTPPYEDTGDFGINIHRGGYGGTSSAGCQTIPPDQWPAFIALVTDRVKRIAGAKWRRQVVTYVLLEGV